MSDFEDEEGLEEENSANLGVGIFASRLFYL